MPKFQEMLRHLNENRHKRTVYEELVNFLSQFVQDEVHKPDRSMLTGDIGPVPQELILGVSSSLQKEIDKLDRAIAEIEGLKVEEPNGKEQATGKAAAKAGGKEANGKAGGSSKPTKAGRISLGHRTKIQGGGGKDRDPPPEPSDAGDQ